MEAQALLQLMQNRRSVRNFSARKLSRDDFRQLISAALWAPSGSNAQAWEFVILAQEEHELMSRMVAFLPGVTEAPAAMLWLCLDCEKEQRKAGKLGLEFMGKLDIAMAAQNIMLMAEAMGLASCTIGSFNETVVRLALKLPDTIQPVLLLIVGEAAKPAKAPPRPPLEQVMHWRTFGNREG